MIDPEMYFQMGYFEKYPENASRAESVEMAAEKRGWKINAEIHDFGMDPILKVHSKEFCEYFKNAYEQWVRVMVEIRMDSFQIHFLFTKLPC